jgi:hypothetical protein
MFSQSAELSQSSNGDYNFLHNSQNSSQFEFYGIQNKATNIFGVGDLGTINEENPISPIKLNFKDESKKSLLNQDISKNTKYSFTNNNNNINSINISQRINPNSNNKTPMQKTTSSISNKENININNNIDISNNNMETNSKVNITLGEVKQGENNFFNFDNYKCQLSQQIDQVEKIAMQSMNPSDNANNSKVNNNYLNEGFVNNNNEEELSEHQKFNQYCSELIDQAMNKNLDYIDNIKKEFVTSLDLYKNKFRTNAEIIKKLILLYSDDVFQKEKNKIIISHLADQLLSHINSFFQEMSKFNNFNLSLNSNCGGNNSIISNQNT